MTGSYRVSQPSRKEADSYLELRKSFSERLGIDDPFVLVGSGVYETFHSGQPIADLGVEDRNRHVGRLLFRLLDGEVRSDGSGRYLNRTLELNLASHFDLHQGQILVETTSCGRADRIHVIDWPIGQPRLAPKYFDMWSVLAAGSKSGEDALKDFGDVAFWIRKTAESSGLTRFELADLEEDLTDLKSRFARWSFEWKRSRQLLKTLI